MNRTIISAVVVLILLLSNVTATDVVFGAFNVQVFGATKEGKQPVMTALAAIIRNRYDIIAIQEIRAESAIGNLTLLVNKGLNDADKYTLVLSSRLGRSDQKEQYGILYKSSIFTEVEHHVYNDVDDVFEREPFIVRFMTRAGTELFFSVIHTKPTEANSEIGALVRVYNETSAAYGLDNAVLMVWSGTAV